MKTRTKLLGLAGILSLMTAILSFISYTGLSDITAQAEKLYGREMQGANYANQIQTDILYVIRDEKNILLSNTDADLQKFMQQLDKGRQELNKDAAAIKKYFITERGKALIAKLDTALAEWSKIHEEVIRLGNTTDTAQSKKAQALSSTTGREKAGALLALADEIVKFKLDNAKQQYESIESEGHSVELTALVATLAAILIGMALGIIITNGILKQLGDEPGSIAGMAQKIADGDLTVKFDPNRPEIGVFGAMKKMVQALVSKIAEADQKSQEALKESNKAKVAMAEADEARKKAETAKAEGMLQAAMELEGIVEVVTSASEELSAQIEQSSRGAEEQARLTGETATAMEEMNATVLEVAKNAAHAAETSGNARHKAQDGSQLVTQVVTSISEVQSQALGMKTDMTSLGKQAEGIGQILNVISDIADQTNLLALNAAIEAARAGEAGRGFAVVADEVRKLAEKTMTATKEVGDAIRGVQDGARKNIHNVEQAVSKIDTATDLANKSGQALGEIVSLVDLATDQVRSIATASEQQSAASDEINRGVEDVSRISAETSDAMRQSSQAVGELAHQAQMLKTLIDQMKHDGGVSSTAPRKAVATAPRRAIAQR
ncbi:Methyl-accepting chemotaxis protein [Desulfovibrio sp. DV]|uniref:methyl-accepting chemotaxis protein n=1 Tax=Desulfovibrio sp. DV TaxID=1844708 RepID=UPI0009666ECE|nr:methyl-accepting chemotaxis protein [Desulfovibrio sp. DV]OLN25772.1 Methyl-accepting chemotaxis protein [Desulfovibrio sp. DV]